MGRRPIISEALKQTPPLDLESRPITNLAKQPIFCPTPCKILPIILLLRKGEGETSRIQSKPFSSSLVAREMTALEREALTFG